MQDLNKQIASLQHHIEIKQAGLRYVDRGYADEQRKIESLQKELAALIKERDSRG